VLLNERQRILSDVAENLRTRGLGMNLPDELFLPESYLDSLDNSISRTQGDRLTEIESELAQLDAAQLAFRLQELLIATVRRHEAQHGFDGSNGLFYPKIVEQNVGPEEIGDRENFKGSSTNAELSAYVSAIASDPVTPRYSYWSMARHAFSDVNWGRAESYVAVMVTEGIAAKLKIAVDGPVIHGGAIDRDRLSKLALQIFAQSDDAIRAAAAACWAELYDAPYNVLHDVKQ
jgi:hypothetical protein